MKPFKFGHCPSVAAGHGSGSELPPHAEYEYPNLWDVQEINGPQRLILAPSRGHVALMMELCRELEGPFWLLYVLLLSRREEHAPGRYQSESELDHTAMDRFMRDFEEFLERDGRHHLWVHSATDQATLVYDNHNVIYAYGPLVRFEHAIKSRGLRRAEVLFPVPHTHSYNPEYDADEARMLSSRAWHYSPLRPGDDPGRD
jgi:hypothetical protein